MGRQGQRPTPNKHSTLHSHTQKPHTQKLVFPYRGHVNSQPQNHTADKNTHTQQTQTQKKEERTAFSNLRGFASFTVSNDRVVIVGEAFFGWGWVLGACNLSSFERFLSVVGSNVPGQVSVSIVVLSDRVLFLKRAPLLYFRTYLSIPVLVELRPY
jgi:hypothetical protein